MATSPTGISRSQENHRGLINITIAVSVKIAAEAPTKVASGGKKGRLRGKLRRPPRKNALSIFFESVTLSNVLPKTYRNIIFPRRWSKLACSKIAVTNVQTRPSTRFLRLKTRLSSTTVGFAVQL